MLKPIDEMQQQLISAAMPIPMGGVPPVEFDSSGVLVKRKIKKKQSVPRGIFMNNTMHQPEMMQQIQHQQQMMGPTQTNNNISMVMVMSNLMTKRKNRKKRTSASAYQKKGTPSKYTNPEFYF